MEEDGHADRLTVKQAAELLGITENAVRARIRTGSLKAKKSGREWMVSVSQLLEAEGVPQSVARYLCQTLAQSLSDNFREILEDTGRKIAYEAADRVNGDIGKLQRELGRKEVQLELAIQEIERLKGDVNAITGEFGKPYRRAADTPPRGEG